MLDMKPVCEEFLLDLYLNRKLTKEDLENKSLSFRFTDFLDVLTNYDIDFSIPAFKLQYPIYKCNTSGVGKFITKSYKPMLLYDLIKASNSVKLSFGYYNEKMDGPYFVNCYLDCYANFYMFTEQIMEQAIEILKENPEIKFDIAIISNPNISMDYYSFYSVFFNNTQIGGVKNPLTLSEKYEKLKDFIVNNINIDSPRFDYNILNIF